MKALSKIYCFIIATALMFGCTQEKPKYTDTPVSGEINISVDESVAPVFRSQVETFSSIYKSAVIHAAFKPEGEVRKDLFSDSTRLIVTTKPLSENEKEWFEQHKIYPTTSKVAIDAIAFLINKSNPDSALTTEKLTSILSGTLKNWNTNSADKKDSIVIVFDNAQSSNTLYVRDSILKGKPFATNCFAVNSNKAVIDYVEQHPNSLGIIALNYISDRDNTQSNEFQSRVSVCSVQNSTDNEYYKPYQAFLALKKYPYSRNIYTICREPRSGLGTGFASFVAGDQGQRIIKLEGLLPATMPVRLILLN